MKKKTTTKTANKKREKRVLYLAVVYGDIDPSVEGPFASEDARDLRAGAIRARNDEDGVFMIDVTDSKVELFAYSAGYMEELIERAEAAVAFGEGV